MGRPGSPERLSGLRVAVIGSGPAGLAAAQQLARAGLPMSAAEVHGVAAGLLCGLADDVDGLWQQALYSELDTNDVLVQECRDATEALLRDRPDGLAGWVVEGRNRSPLLDVIDSLI